VGKENKEDTTTASNSSGNICVSTKDSLPSPQRCPPHNNVPASSSWPLKRRTELYLVHCSLWNYASLKKTTPASVFFQADCQPEERGKGRRGNFARMF